MTTSPHPGWPILRAGLTVLALIVTLGSYAEGGEAQKDQCVAWVLNGYRVGMSREEALAVRPVNAKISKNMQRHLLPGWQMFKVKAKGFEGNLFLDKNDLLVAWSSVPTGQADQRAIRETLEARLGPPIKDQPEDAHWNSGFKDVGSIAEWKSEECDAIIRLTTTDVRVLPPKVIVGIYLERLSALRERGAAALD